MEFLLTGLVNAAESIKDSKHLTSVDRAAELADFLRVQGENLTIWLRTQQRLIQRQNEYSRNADSFGLAADNLKHVCVAAAETLWNIRQIDQKRELGEQ